MVVGARRTIWEAMDGGYRGRWSIGIVKGVTGGHVHQVSVPEIPGWGHDGPLMRPLRSYSIALVYTSQ